MNHYFIVAACVVGLLTTSCADAHRPNETGGMLVGGLAGGLLGSQFGKGRGALVGAGLGTLVGAYAGSQVGRSMDRPDPPRYRDERRYYREEPWYYGDAPHYRNDDRYPDAPRYERSAYDGYERDLYYRY